MRRLTALTTAVLTLAAAPTALAHTRHVGSTAGDATQNVCVADFSCTYVNVKDGKPTDVVKRSGTIRSWSVKAGSDGGTVRLRVLRPLGHGKYRFVRTSAPHSTPAGLNTYSAKLRVRRGDVLALQNKTSGIYMRAGGPGEEIRYFDYTSHSKDGQSDRFARTAPALHTLLAATVIG